MDNVTKINRGFCKKYMTSDVYRFFTENRILSEFIKSVNSTLSGTWKYSLDQVILWISYNDPIAVINLLINWYYIQTTMDLNWRSLFYHRNPDISRRKILKR